MSFCINYVLVTLNDLNNPQTTLVFIGIYFFQIKTPSENSDNIAKKKKKHTSSMFFIVKY